MDDWTTLVLGILEVLLQKEENHCRVSLAPGSILIEYDEPPDEGDFSLMG